MEERGRERKGGRQREEETEGEEKEGMQSGRQVGYEKKLKVGNLKAVFVGTRRTDTRP